MLNCDIRMLHWVITLMSSNVEHFFLYFYAICILPSEEKYLQISKFSLWSRQIFGGCGKYRILVKVNWMDKRRGQIQMRDKSIQ